MSFGGGFGGFPRKPKFQKSQAKPAAAPEKSPSSKPAAAAPKAKVQRPPRPRGTSIEAARVKAASRKHPEPKPAKLAGRVRLRPSLLPSGARLTRAGGRPGAPLYHVVILSQRDENLKRCLSALRERHPALPPSAVIVVDDGLSQAARDEWKGVTWLTGQKPFIFARNANLGIRAAGTDVVLLNDDAFLQTPGGLDFLAAAARNEEDGFGLVSAGLLGRVGNHNQSVKEGTEGTRAEKETLTFVCVYIPRRTIEVVGPLDERFIGYGFEDNDFCLRARNAGLRLGVVDRCVVDHSDPLLSSFRSKPDYVKLFEQNREIYVSKWGRK